VSRVDVHRVRNPSRIRSVQVVENRQPTAHVKRWNSKLILSFDSLSSGLAASSELTRPVSGEPLAN
jgi:hypothetical protein